MSDPLVGLMQWRLQTHNGDNVPLALWKNSGGTIPATAEGDTVVLWTDVLTASGLAVTVSGATLTFVNGIPTLVGSPINLTYPSTPWFTSKRGTLYSAALRSLSCPTDQGWYAETSTQGAGNPFILYDVLSAYNAPNFIYAIYDGTNFLNGVICDFGWETRAFTRSTDTSFQLWRANALEATLITSNVQQTTSTATGVIYGNAVAICLSVNAHNSVVEPYLQSLSPSNPSWVTFIKCVADSLTAGLGATGFGNYPAQLQLYYDPAFVGVRNYGVPSATIANAVTNAPLIDGNWPTFVNRKIVCAWVGTNSLYFGVSAASTYSQYVAYCQARQLAGEKVVAFTILPRDDAGTPPTFDADRLAVNALIVANFTTFANVLANVAAIPQLSDPDNATYYADHVHLTNAGYALVAPVVKTAIDSIPSGNAMQPLHFGGVGTGIRIG